MKSPEFIPRTEEDQEEDLRLYGNDKAHTFIPIEQVPDVVDEATEKYEEQEDSEEESVVHDASLRESILRKEIEEQYQPLGKEKKATISLEPELYFHQEIGVASIGPDVHPVLPTDSSSETLSDHEQESVYVGKEDSSFSPHIVEPLYHNKKLSREGNTGKEHNNLKTMTPGKKERGLRGMIRHWLSIQNNEETPQHTRENKMMVMDELEDDPKNPDLVVTAAHSTAQEDQNMVA